MSNLSILAHINSRLEVFLAIENIVVMVTALVGNVLMCIAVVRLLRKRVPSNLFILSLVGIAISTPKISVKY